jgi:protein TonB
MDLKRRPDSLLLVFITFSLLLHLLLYFLLPQRNPIPVSSLPETIIVEMRPPTPTPPQQRELDLPVRPEPEKPRETPAKRLGPADQLAKKEKAPKGADPEDRRPAAPAPPPPPPQPAPQAPPEAPRPAVETPARQTPAERPEIAEQPSAPAAPPPDLKALTQLPPATIARLEKGWEKELRHKYRPGVEQGDTYWLDTEKDILISFFQRFRSNIYAVWSYPLKAKERGEEGGCLLKVTINRDGTLRDVQVMESSGFPLLDDEAVAAVKKGAPFGELHSAYEEETISIFAFFQYNLLRSNLRRPGDIY